jgi:hypothetical protein
LVVYSFTNCVIGSALAGPLASTVVEEVQPF